MEVRSIGLRGAWKDQDWTPVKVPQGAYCRPVGTSAGERCGEWKGEVAQHDAPPRIPGFRPYRDVGAGPEKDARGR